MIVGTVWDVTTLDVTRPLTDEEVPPRLAEVADDWITLELPYRREDRVVVDVTTPMALLVCWGGWDV